jgi:predicted  nucleic acid-binding Zn-ribbon protein
MTDNEYKYWAFLSYSHEDNREQRPDAPGASGRCWGQWLHDALKTFSIPAEFVGQINGHGEIIPERIEPLFQDEPEQSEEAAPDADIRQALEQSRYLIVICSPRSAQSPRVNEAVRYFKQLGRGKHILPLVVAGKPNASDGHQPGGAPEAECLVPALRHPVRPDGTLDTTRRAGRFVFVDARHGVENREILAQDHRNAEADLEMAKIQLIALLIGVGFNGLWWREQKRYFFDLTAAQRQAREAQHQVGEVRHQLEEAQHQIQAAQSRALEQQNLPRNIEEQIQAAQDQARQAQNQAREAQQQLQEFQNKVRDTQTELAAARDRARAAESQVVAVQQQVQEARNQLEAVRNQIPAAQPPVLEIKNPLPDVSARIQEAQDQVLAAQQQAQDAQSQLEEIRHQAQDAQNKFLAAQSQVEEFQNQARSAQSQLEEARNQAHAAQSRVEAAEQQTRAAQSQVREIQDQTRGVQSQIAEAQNQVQKINSQGRTTRRLIQVFALLAALALLAAGMATRMAVRQRKVASQALAQAAAEGAGTFALPSDGAAPAQIQQMLQKIGGAEQNENRRRSLDQLAIGIPPEAIPEALKASAVLLNDSQRSDFQKRLLVRLGGVNPAAAMICASAVEGKIVNEAGAGDSAIYFQLAVLDGWMKTDLSGAFNWVCQLPDADARQRALEKIIPALAADNPQNTLARLNDLKAAPDEQVYRLLFQRWAAKDPVQAIQQRQQVPNHDQDDSILCAIMTVWVDQQPEAALDWVKAQPDSASKDKALETCMGELAKTDVPRARALAESLPEGAWRSSVISSLAGRAAPSAALQWGNDLDLLQEIMPSRPAPLPWTKFLLNSNFVSPSIFSVETNILSNTTNGPISIKPQE